VIASKYLVIMQTRHGRKRQLWNIPTSASDDDWKSAGTICPFVTARNLWDLCTQGITPLGADSLIDVVCPAYSFIGTTQEVCNPVSAA